MNHEQTPEEPRKISRQEAQAYDGETIEVGDPQKKAKKQEFEEYQENPFGSSHFQVKVYRGNWLLILLMALLAMIVIFFLIIALPVGLFLLGCMLVIAFVKHILGF